jgi:hypothetical protein
MHSLNLYLSGSIGYCRYKIDIQKVRAYIETGVTERETHMRSFLPETLAGRKECNRISRQGKPEKQ